MQAFTEDHISFLIETYDLHASTPVQLDSLEALFCPEHRTLDDFGVAGVVILPGGEVTPANFVRVILSDRLSPYEARLVYAHEVGHAILGHEGESRFADMDSWFVDKSEREAWQVAARLLVPIDAVVQYEEVGAIADACQVPKHLVQLAYR